MNKRNYLTIERPDKSATVDLLNSAPLLDASVIIERDGSTLRITAKVLNPGGDTWTEETLEMKLN